MVGFFVVHYGEFSMHSTWSVKDWNTPPFALLGVWVAGDGRGDSFT
jgi:hypothetical protein